MVLDAWSASPARFREDANAEEALAVGGYAGRVLVELGSNAVDAAAELGVPARIRIRLADGELRVANTGAPLTAQGVAGLASLRASAKRETHDSVGHFGVGFTAVLSWSAAPRVVSSSGGVRFDGAATRVAIADLGSPSLDREVVLRSGAVPVLRLPWPVDPDEPGPPDGYTTEVRLPLRDSALADVRRFLADPAAAEDLFWALTGLSEIDLPDRVVHTGIDEAGFTVLDDGRSRTRYRTAERSGRIPAALLTDRPIEERSRTQWRITWALPVSDGDGDGDVVGLDALLAEGLRTDAVPLTIGAPTPTDEPLTLPARLIGTFPVDDTRRRLAAGPLREHLLDEAADLYLELVAGADPPDRWKLLPGTGFPAGPVDAALREAIGHRVQSTPLLLTAAGDLVTPADACWLPGLGADGTALFGQAIPGLLPPQPRAAKAVLRGLGAQMLSWSQASAAIAVIDRDPEFWWQVYEAVATAERAPLTEDLADIPIPLIGGRRALGARGCLLPAEDDAAAGSRIDAELARRAGRVVTGLRIIEPAAAHPYLERLGARPAGPDTLLGDPALTGALDGMLADLDDADPDPDDLRELARVVLDLIAAGGRASRSDQGRSDRAEAVAGADTPGAVLTGELVLTDADDQPWPAAELLLPGAPLATVLADDADRPLIGAEWLERYPEWVLVAAGVRSGFAVVTVTDASAADRPALPDLDEWLGGPGRDADTPSVTGLADLDLIDDDRWPEALRLIASDREARACLLLPGSYSGWWLARHAWIGDRRPTSWRLRTAHDLDGLFDVLPLDLDDQLARAIGVRAGLADAAADDPEDLLDRLADPTRQVPAGRVAAVTAAVVAALSSYDDVDLPSGVRTLTGDVADAADAFVLDAPWLAQVLAPADLVPGGADPEQVARVLDLPLASTREVVVSSANGPPQEGDGATDRVRVAAVALGLDPRAVDVTVRPALQVAVDGAPPVPVRWWGGGVSGSGILTDGSAEGVGRAVAWAAGCWPRRHLAAAAAAGDEVGIAESSFD
ncbi:sacsin N-terminal ATP-binding-like domain-containing protein [Nakamurella sp. GG22]